MTATTASPRMQRIKIVSRVFRYLVLANLVFNVGFQLVLFRFSGVTIRGGLLSAAFLLMYFWFWQLANLFRLYERGLIFATETIRCIKLLGVVCLTGWLVLTTAHFASRPEPASDHPPIGATVTVVKAPRYQMGFLSFNFGTSIDFGYLFVGAAVVLAAWIMDEGRKIQEEQELTV